MLAAVVVVVAVLLESSLGERMPHAMTRGDHPEGIKSEMYSALHPTADASGDTRAAADSVRKAAHPAIVEPTFFHIDRRGGSGEEDDERNRHAAAVYESKVVFVTPTMMKAAGGGRRRGGMTSTTTLLLVVSTINSANDDRTTNDRAQPQARPRAAIVCGTTSCRYRLCAAGREAAPFRMIGINAPTWTHPPPPPLQVMSARRASTAVRRRCERRWRAPPPPARPTRPARRSTAR